MIAFSQFEVEQSYDESECSFDYLEIVQKKSDDKEVAQSEKYCTTMPKEFTSIGDIVVVKYVFKKEYYLNRSLQILFQI